MRNHTTKLALGLCLLALACHKEEDAMLRDCPAEAPVDCHSTRAGICCPSSAPYCCATGEPCRASATSCMGSMMSCDGRSCATSGGCCKGFTCARFGRTCHAAQNLPIGDACTEHEQCASASCSAYCTRPCVTSAACGAANFCLETEGGIFQCIPFCSTDADCVVFGKDVTCQVGQDPGGLMLRGCFAK